MTDPLPWAAPPASLEDSEAELTEITLPGAGLSSLGGALTPDAAERVLMNVFVEGRSGRLAIEAQPKPRGTLFFLRGDPVYAQPTDADARLLQRLHVAGVLDDEAMPDPTQPLVTLLARKRWASPYAILRALRDEILEFMRDLVEAKTGVYRFFDDFDLGDVVPLVPHSTFGMLIEHKRKRASPAALLEAGEKIAKRYAHPQQGFANASARMRAFTGSVDLADIVDGRTVVADLYRAMGLDELMGGLVIATLVDGGLLQLSTDAAAEAVHDRRKAATNVLPHVIPVQQPEKPEATTISAIPESGGAELLNLYLELKPERDDDALLGCAKDATPSDVERAFQTRMAELDPRAVRAGPSRPHLLGRIEELRAKIERAYRNRTDGVAKSNAYEIHGRLGAGGMAEVFAGVASDDPSRRVAIKRILPKYRADAGFVKMFLREARLAQRIQHKNVVRVYSAGKAGDEMYIAMEFVDGRDLSQLLQYAHMREEKVPVEVACRIVADVCGGLHAAHTARGKDGKPRPILHRDVSPHNVLVSFDGDVKLTDFGVAKSTGNTSVSAERSGFVKGKVAYLAPELINGLPATVKTDVYAAAMTLYAALGSLPYRKRDLLATMRAIISEPLPPPSSFRDDIPPALDALALRAGARNAEERPASAQAFQLELEEFLAHRPPADVAAWVKSFDLRNERDDEHGADDVVLDGHTHTATAVSVEVDDL